VCARTARTGSAESKKAAAGASPKPFGGGDARFLDFPEGKAVVNDAKVAETARRDGLRPTVARGNDRLPPEAPPSQCRQLRTIRRRFRANRHDMRIRPLRANRHDMRIRPLCRWKPRRTPARVAFRCVRLHPDAGWTCDPSSPASTVALRFHWRPRPGTKPLPVPERKAREEDPERLTPPAGCPGHFRRLRHPLCRGEQVSQPGKPLP